MDSVDRMASKAILMPMAPIALFLAGWWGSLAALGDSPAIIAWAFTGLLVGMVLDLTLLRRGVGSLLEMGDRQLLAVALFYSVGMYGLFMGLPLFNVAVGAVGGFVVARRAVGMGWTRERAVRDGRRVAITMTCVLGALCVVTAWLALREPTMGAQLQGMLGLRSPVSWPGIYAIIGFGGTGLLAVQYAATTLTSRWFAPK